MRKGKIMKDVIKQKRGNLCLNVLAAVFLCMMMLFCSSYQAHAQDYPIDVNTFKNSGFVDFIESNYDTNHDGILSQAEADSVKQIAFDVWFNDYDISNLGGLEVFRNLEELIADEIRLEYLDVSKNESLRLLSVNYDHLSKLDLSKNTNLETLRCDANDNLNLILPKSSSLKSLSCFGCDLTSLDLTGCPNLEYLDCGGNDLTSLNLSANTKLTGLDCISTNMKSLDISKNTKLRSLTCSSNSFKNLDISNNYDLLYVYQQGWKNEIDYEGVEAVEYGCMYGSDTYSLTVPPSTKIVTGGNYGGKDGSTIETPNGKYKVLSTKSKTVAYYSAPNKKNVTVPATFKVNGKKYKVTEIWGPAFRGKKIRTVTIGKNVKLIRSNAFNASKATKLIVKTKLLKKAKVKGCLSSSNVKTIQVKVGKKSLNKTYVKKYKKYFTEKNAGSKVRVI